MNIIIESLNSIRLTGTSTDLDSAKLFVHKSIDNAEQIIISLIDASQQEYVLDKTLFKELEKTYYLGYQLTPTCNIPAGTYSIKASRDNLNLLLPEVRISETNALIDEHEPTRITGRKIGPVDTKIIAQDLNSQQLTFYIKQKYDGVSFVDDSKKVMFDYIPLDPQDLIDATPDGAPTLSFLSSEAIVIKDNVIPPKGQTGEWMLLKWNLPYYATKKAGVVKFAISVIDKQNEYRYLWQTESSSFTVQPNLAFRSGAIVPPPEDVVIPEELEDLTERVNDLEAFLGYQTDDNAANDMPIILGGGSAASYLEEDKI